MYNLPQLGNQKEYQNHVENELSNTMLLGTWKITYMQQQYSSKKRLSLTVPNVFIKHRIGLEKNNKNVIVRFITYYQIPACLVFDLSVTFSLIFQFKAICQ